MAAVDYVKDDAVAFGRAIGNLVNAVRGDGVGADDFDELIGALTAGAKAVNEMKDVPEAGSTHVLGAALDTVGDKALADAIAKEAEVE